MPEQRDLRGPEPVTPPDVESLTLGGPSCAVPPAEAPRSVAEPIPDGPIHDGPIHDGPAEAAAAPNTPAPNTPVRRSPGGQAPAARRRLFGRRRTQRTANLHRADEISILAIERRGEAGLRQHWVHHLYFAQEGPAREAGERATAAGWTVEHLGAQPEPFQSWLLRVGQEAVIDRDLAIDTRTFFERLAHDTAGSYQGWDAFPAPKHAQDPAPGSHTTDPGAAQQNRQNMSIRA